MIAALWSNSNWDDDKGTRKNAITGINDNYREAMMAIEDAMTYVDRSEEEKVDDSNPFFAAAERGLSQVMQEATQRGYKPPPEPVEPEETEEEFDYMKGLDQE